MTKFKNIVFFCSLAIINGLMALVPTFRLRRTILRLAQATIASDVTVHRQIRLFGFGRFACGPGTTINRGVYLDSRKGINIGRNVMIAHDCRLYTLGHDIDDTSFSAVGAPIFIEDHAVLFAGVAVMPGVRIGDRAVVYPYSVVTKNIPSGEVWGGNPAIKIRDRNISEATINYEAKYPQWLGN